MKPKGLVDDAAITSQTSMPSLSKRSLSSLTSAMLTARNVFSSIFVASATAGELTGTVTGTTAS